MCFRFSCLARSCALDIFGVLLRLTPRLRAFPKGPFSSGMRRLEFSELETSHMLAVDHNAREWHESWREKLRDRTKATYMMSEGVCLPTLFTATRARSQRGHLTWHCTYSGSSKAHGKRRPVESKARSASGTAWTCIVMCGGVGRVDVGALLFITVGEHGEKHKVRGVIAPQWLVSPTSFSQHHPRSTASE